MKKAIINTLVTFVVLFLGASFINCTFNVYTWDAFSRVVVGVGSVGAFLVTVMANYLEGTVK